MLLLVSIPPIAFGFATPWLLWGLALGAVPPLIHLLNRRKFRETQWAAMRFLAEAIRKNSRRMRIEQLILLLVRISIMVLLVLGLAQPQFETLTRFFLNSVPTHRIIVLDSSFSMGYRDSNQSRFQMAQELAGQIVASGRQGDAFNLVRISGSEPQVIIRKPTFQTDEMQREISQLTLPDERADVHPALVEADKLLQEIPEISQKEVIIISDLQQSSWHADAAGKQAEIRVLLKKIAATARLVLIDVGQGGHENHAITDLRAQQDLITVDQPTRFTVSTTAFARTGQETRLDFLVDGKLQASRDIQLQPLTVTTEEFAYQFAGGGEHVVQARLTEDHLAVDDQRQWIISVKDRLRVLCVNGNLAGRANETATHHLQLALAPKTKSAVGESLIQPQVIKEGELRGFDLNQYDCVFLCDVSSFDDSEVLLLETYIKGGGAVVWCLGDRTSAENYNRLLYRNGQGILPAMLMDRRGNAVQRTEASVFTFDPLNFKHPILKVFQGNPNSGLERTQTFEYFRTKLSEHNPGTVALAFNTGDPAIVVQQVGGGKAILITTAVDKSWGNLAIWPSFLPLMQELVFYAVSNNRSDQGLLAGEPWTRTVQTRGAEVTGSVRRPDGITEPLTASPGANLADFHYDHTERAGIYEAEFGAPLNRKEKFAVNIDATESNLTRIEKDELERELLAGVEFSYLTDWTTLERRSDGTRSETSEATLILLHIVLYLLFVEQLLAWNFLNGLWLLCPPLMAVIWWRSRKP
ncbi:MAG: hypothetical protein JWM11_2499 [Planctomycetaceae bacterium]|nr:hypothetical protein [Planctomycetaceae bacterium]